MPGLNVGGMSQTLILRLFSLTLAATLLLTGCNTPGSYGDDAVRAANQQAAILSEAPGNYYIGHRYFNPNYKFWGYLRKPGQPWRTARLVVLDENQVKAPDRVLNQFGADNDSEYRLYGQFAPKVVYEPASNHFYPHFMLTKIELIQPSAPSIFPSSARQQPSTVISEPY